MSEYTTSVLAWIQRPVLIKYDLGEPKSVKTHLERDRRRLNFLLFFMTDPTAYRGLRPKLSKRFYKAHGLGNDYLVFERFEDDEGYWVATPKNVSIVCDPHRGLGSDGIVALLSERSVKSPTQLSVSLRMFNPDGSEFERSGNGLRVLAAHLSTREPQLDVIDAEVGGERVRIHVHGMREGIFDASVEMGSARLGPVAIGAESDLLRGDSAPYTLIGPGGELLEVVPVSIGNPHVVILAGSEEQSFCEDRLSALGPFISAHPSILAGANVQLARVLDGRAQAYIWERGVGSTSASGTSSCAVAVALVATGLLPPGEVLVDMPGGRLTVLIGASLAVTLRGPVTSVMSGMLEEGLLATFEHGS